MATNSAVDFDNPGKQVQKPTRLAHVVLRTSNLKRLREFYLTFLGAHIQYENDYLCFITYDEEHHRIAIAEIEGTQDKIQTSCGLEHIAFTYPTLSDLMLAYRQRLPYGIKPHWCVNHGPTTSLYYKDPDGNMLENQVDNMDSPEAANDFMMGEQFHVNPIGVDFDPEDLIKRIKSGESEESMKKRPESGPRVIPEIMLGH